MSPLLAEMFRRPPVQRMLRYLTPEEDEQLEELLTLAAVQR